MILHRQHRQRIKLLTIGLAAIVLAGCTSLFSPTPSPLVSSNVAYTVNGGVVGGDYADANGTQLTDGQVASTDFMDGGWVGIRGSGQHEVTLDLGNENLVTFVRVHALSNPNVGITYPAAIHVSVSRDEVNWSVPARVEITQPPTSREATWLVIPDVHERGRYVKISLDSEHEWSFISEIEVYSFE